jgi:DNA primase
LAQPLGDGDLVRKIKDSLDIVDLIGSYIELKQRGANYLALCPFHAEKTPSFSVNRQGQFFHCFGCKKSGDVFDFVMAMEGISFGEACGSNPV